MDMDMDTDTDMDMDMDVDIDMDMDTHFVMKVATVLLNVRMHSQTRTSPRRFDAVIGWLHVPCGVQPLGGYVLLRVFASACTTEFCFC